MTKTKKSATTTPTLLDRACSRGQQSLDYRAIWMLGEHKLCVRRKRDAYDFQSSATVDRWDGEKWHRVDSIHFSRMNTGQGDSYVSKDARPNRSELLDEEELLRLAALVLL